MKHVAKALVTLIYKYDFVSDLHLTVQPLS